MGKKKLAEYLAEFQQYIKDTGFDIDNQFFFWLAVHGNFRNFWYCYDLGLDKKGLPRDVCQIWFGSLGKRPGTFRTFRTLGTLHVPNVSDVPDVPFHIYIYIYIAISQINSFFFLTVNTFINWIFNVIFNPIHHHCHLFTDFYKKLICVEFKPLFIVWKKKVKNAMFTMDRFESLKDMINIAVKIDDRQHDRFFDKKTWSKPIPSQKINHNLKRTPWSLLLQKKKVLKKLLLSRFELRIELRT